MLNSTPRGIFHLNDPSSIPPSRQQFERNIVGEGIRLPTASDLCDPTLDPLQRPRDRTYPVLFGLACLCLSGLLAAFLKQARTKAAEVEDLLISLHSKRQKIVSKKESNKRERTSAIGNCRTEKISGAQLSQNRSVIFTPSGRHTALREPRRFGGWELEKRLHVQMSSVTCLAQT